MPPFVHTTCVPVNEVDEHNPNELPPKRLVLVGGGHGHVQVIKALHRLNRPANLQVDLIDVQQAASYSGMVPGCVSGMYTHPQTQLELPPLAKWAGLTFWHRRVVDIDLDQKVIHMEPDATDTSDTTTLSFDVLSLDIGSTTRAFHEVPGADQYTIPTRPIDKLVLRLEDATEELRRTQPAVVRVVVCGAGIAGVELAMSLHARWSAVLTDPNQQQELHVTLLDANCKHTILPGETPACRDKLWKILRDKNIHVRFECGVKEITKDTVILNNAAAEPLPFTYCLWATGAGAHDLAWTLAKRGLAVDRYGWFQVNEYLQSTSHPFVFGAGDCTSHPSHPPKAGVYAVRSGPILIQNLTAQLYGRIAMANFVPQSDFLKLLACGGGKALGFRFGIPVYGKWVWQIKDTIDQAFMDLFRVENLPVYDDVDEDDKAAETKTSGTAARRKKTLDTSQYDAAYACRDHDHPLNPHQAAQLLLREDDDVDHQVAWKLLRDLVCMVNYRDQVVASWHEIVGDSNQSPQQ